MKSIPITQIHAFLNREYALGQTVEVQPIHKGEENRNFFIKAGADQYVLRVYSTHHSTTGLRKQPEIEFELEFMEAAQAHGVPTPPVIRAKSGERVAPLQMLGRSNFAVLFGYAHGGEAADYNPERARAAAQTLLNLRRVSLSFRRPVPRSWPGDIARLSLEFYTAHRDRIPYHKDLLDRLYRSSLDGYAQILDAGLPNGVIHGDVKLGNLLFQRDQVSAVIDFDDYRETFLLEEFTRTVMHDLDSPTRNVIRAGCYSQFFEAFASDSTVTSAEKAHLNTFLRARLAYDLASYSLAGLDRLVDEVLADQNVREVILAGF